MNPPGRSSSAFTLLEMMMMFIIITILALIIIPRLTQSRIDVNDSIAQTNLKTISTAAEMFAKVNEGMYPTHITSLTAATPPYLYRSYCGEEISGFNFICNMNMGGYTIYASPRVMGETGSTIFLIETGGVLKSP